MHACQSVTPARKCVECTTMSFIIYLRLFNITQYTHLSHFLSRMRFKTNISFLTGLMMLLQPGITLRNVKSLLLMKERLEAGQMEYTQLYILYVNYMHNWNAGEYRRTVPVHLYSRLLALHCHQQDK